MGSKTIGTSLFAAVLALALATPATAGTTRSNVYRFADGSQVAGAWSVLTTTDAGARMTLQTSELPAGHSVSVWWIIFNAPQNCTHPEGGLRCGPGDLPPFGGDDSAVTSIAYAAGHVIGGSGQATFAGRLATGDTKGAVFGPGLVNPTTADIHLLVRDQGEKDPGSESRSFSACNPTCTILQASPHEQ